MLKSDARILIVDDMETMCELERNYLNELGYINTYKCNDAASAKSALLNASEQKRPFDVVLSDISMPGESGLDLLKWIRSRDEFAKLPVILVSAMGDLDHVMEAAERGATSFIVKPLQKEKLKEKLSKL